MNNHGECTSIADPFVVASRGREPAVLTQKRNDYGKAVRKDYENGKTKEKRKYMQNYEPRIDGVTNTLTSVQKGNLLVEPVRIKANTIKGYEEVGGYGAVNVSHPSSTTRRGRVQGNKGDIVGALTTGEENVLIEPMAPVHPLSHALEFKGAKSLSEVSSTIRATEAKAVTCAWEPTERVRQVAERVRQRPCGVTIGEDNSLRPYRMDAKKGGVAELQIDNDESVSSTLVTAHQGKVFGVSTQFEVRRLTPRECFRLQDVDEHYIDAIQAHEYPFGKKGQMKRISDTQQYKLAGNSIVVACMEFIFENLFGNPVAKPIDTTPKQLNLFDIL